MMVMLIMIVFVGVGLHRMDMLMSVHLVPVLWYHTDVPVELTERLKQRVDSVEGVVKGSTELRAHFVGNRPYVEVTLGTPRGGSLESAHHLSEAVETAIRRELAGAQATVHVEPRATPHEAPAAGLRAVADRLSLRVHNVNVYQLGKETHIDLDLELPDDLSLAEAHKRS